MPGAGGSWESGTGTGSAARLGVIVVAAMGRTNVGTSGFGKRTASNPSISCPVLRVAIAKRSSEFSDFRCGASRTTAVRWSLPSASASKMAGNF